MWSKFSLIAAIFFTIAFVVFAVYLLFILNHPALFYLAITLEGIMIGSWINFDENKGEK